MARTGLCSQYEVTALYECGRGPWGLQRRAQGLSLPLQLQVRCAFVCVCVCVCYLGQFVKPEVFCAESFANI